MPYRSDPLLWSDLDPNKKYFLENAAQVRGILRRDAEDDDVTIMDCDANSEHLCPRYDKKNPVRGLQQIVKVYKWK